MGKTAVVLGGGGIKAAYEAGVLRTLAAAGIVPEVIVGISAGALNGAILAKLVAQGDYGPEALDDLLSRMWLAHGSLEDFASRSAGSTVRFGEHSVQSLFQRVGIDPLRRVFWLRPTLDALLAFRELVLGRFTSLVSHGFLEEMLDTYLLPPDRVRHPVVFSIAISNLLGTTQLENRLIRARHSHYETFRLSAPPEVEDYPAMFSWMRHVILASCSVPMVFPPVRLHMPNTERPGIYLDGGMVESWPITHALELDPEVDTVIVVMAATVVGEPSHEPTTFLQLIGRVFSIIAGRYLIHNYQEVARMNERILAMREVLERTRGGEVARSRSNEALCRAAGFDGVAGFLTKRYVRLVPIAPTEPLRGGIFSALFYPELKASYLERGMQDARLALAQLAAPLPQELPWS